MRRYTKELASDPVLVSYVCRFVSACIQQDDQLLTYTVQCTYIYTVFVPFVTRNQADNAVPLMYISLPATITLPEEKISREPTGRQIIREHSTLLEKFWWISLYLTADAIVKLCKT